VFHNQRWGRLIEDFSWLRGEAEILLPPGATYRITQQFERDSPTDPWRSADGTAGLTGDVATFAQHDGQRDSRRLYLEFREV
jgi:hypothetical protein